MGCKVIYTLAEKNRKIKPLKFYLQSHLKHKVITDKFNKILQDLCTESDKTLLRKIKKT